MVPFPPPDTHLPAVTRLEHVVASVPVDAVAWPRSSVAHDQAVAAAEWPAHLAEHRHRDDVAQGLVDRRPDGDEAATDQARTRL